MQLKTNVHAEPDKQELFISRVFELPVAKLFLAYTQPELVEQWMGTKVLKLENKAHGSYQFETTDPLGNAHRFNGTIHEFEPGQKITRTFEMEGSQFPVQLEYLEFAALTENSSKLTIQIVFKSVTYRDQLLQMPFAYGINMAHNKLQDIIGNMEYHPTNPG